MPFMKSFSFPPIHYRRKQIRQNHYNLLIFAIPLRLTGLGVTLADSGHNPSHCHIFVLKRSQIGQFNHVGIAYILQDNSILIQWMGRKINSYQITLLVETFQISPLSVPELFREYATSIWFSPPNKELDAAAYPFDIYFHSVPILP